MKASRTRVLILLVLAGAIAAIAGYARMAGAREAAALAGEDLEACRRYIGGIAGVTQGAAGRRALVGGPDSVALNARLREAAAAAGVADRLLSVEPGVATRLRDTDYKELQVFLRLEPVTLRQLTTFLHALSVKDADSRTKTIELSVPQRGAGEQWTADVAVGYLIFSPRDAAGEGK
jgi:hypothetical protein